MSAKKSFEGSLEKHNPEEGGEEGGEAKFNKNTVGTDREGTLREIEGRKRDVQEGDRN